MDSEVTLQVIPVDQLKAGDVVIINLKASLSDEEKVRAGEQWGKLFPNNPVVINADQGNLEIKRP